MERAAVYRLLVVKLSQSPEETLTIGRVTFGGWLLPMISVRTCETHMEVS